MKNIQDLQTKGFVIVDYPAELRKAVEETAELWKEFCSLPTEIKKGLPYSNGQDGVGYEIKDGSGPNGDKKENFDVAGAGVEWLKKHSEEISSPIAVKFIESALNITRLIKPLVCEFAQAIEDEFGIPGFANEIEEGQNRIFVRWIHYFGDRKPGEETASSHIDQSGMTPHLWESAPGFQYLTYDGKWEDASFPKGTTFIIPSAQMPLKHSGFRAMCHRVIATEETAKNGRYSAVCFVQFAKTPKYDKDTYGRLQEKTPGFNYNMPYDEYVKMFK